PQEAGGRSVRVDPRRLSTQGGAAARGGSGRAGETGPLVLEFPPDRRGQGAACEGAGDQPRPRAGAGHAGQPEGFGVTTIEPIRSRGASDVGRGGRRGPV